MSWCLVGSHTHVPCPNQALHPLSSSSGAKPSLALQEVLCLADEGIPPSEYLLCCRLQVMQAAAELDSYPCRCWSSALLLRTRSS